MNSLLRRILVNRQDGDGGYFAGGLDAILLFVCIKPAERIDGLLSTPLQMGMLTPRDWTELIIYHGMQIEVEPGIFLYDLLYESYNKKPLELENSEIPFLHEVTHDISCRIVEASRLYPKIIEELKEEMNEILKSRYRK